MALLDDSIFSRKKMTLKDYDDVCVKVFICIVFAALKQGF
jgi:hypothetical protein